MSSLFDKIKDKLTPEPSGAPLSTSASRGIGNMRGTLGFEDDNVSTLFPFKVFASRCDFAKRVALSILVRFRTTLRNYACSLEPRP
jgi:hypothetical protein